MKNKAIHIHLIRVGPNWMDPIMLFLKEDILPEEKSEADKVRRKAPRFWLSKDQKLYKCSFSRPYLLCKYLEASELLLEELHKGIYRATQEADLCLIEPLHRDIGGRTYRRRFKNM